MRSWRISKTTVPSWPRGPPAVGNLQADTRQTDFDIQAQTARVDSLARQMNAQAATQTNQLLFQNPVAQQLEAQLIQLQVQLTSQLAIHTENYPGVVAMEATVQAIKDRLNTEVSKIISAQQVVHNPLYDALSQQRVAGETDLLALMRGSRRSPARSGMTQQLPGTAQTQLDAARLTRGRHPRPGADRPPEPARAGDLARAGGPEYRALSVLDHARSAAQSPLGGLRFKLMIALVLGLSAGLASRSSSSIWTIGSRPRRPPSVCWACPRWSRFRATTRRSTKRTGCSGSISGHNTGGRGDVITLTSLKPRSGTSTVVANLARAFAQAGRRTIVVDAAFSSPAQHRLFDVPNERGLAQVLAGDATIADVLAPAGTNSGSCPPARAVRRIAGLRRESAK